MTLEEYLNIPYDDRELEEFYSLSEEDQKIALTEEKKIYDQQREDTWNALSEAEKERIRENLMSRFWEDWTDDDDDRDDENSEE